MKFEELINVIFHSDDNDKRKEAEEMLERNYGCEINCTEIDPSVKFAHHARGCTIVAAKICENAVILQNVTIGSNLKYNKKTNEWENVGNPIIGKNVVVADGAKVLGPIIIGENSVIGAGAIITKDIPANSIAYGVNKFKPKDSNYDLIFNENMIDFEKIIEANKELIAKYEQGSK
jgi:Serine acetyltransferase